MSLAPVQYPLHMISDDTAFVARGEEATAARAFPVPRRILSLLVRVGSARTIVEIAAGKSYYKYSTGITHGAALLEECNQPTSVYNSTIVQSTLRAFKRPLLVCFGAPRIASSVGGGQGGDVIYLTAGGGQVSHRRRFTQVSTDATTPALHTVKSPGGGREMIG